MELKTILVLAGAAVLLSGQPVLAGKVSVEHGKELFNNPGLGGSTKGKSCNGCHPDGAKLEKAGAGKGLSKAINRCITGQMTGKKIDGRNAEMKSLKMYIESLGQK